MDEATYTAFLELKERGRRKVVSWDDELVTQAFDLAYRSHKNQRRQTGEIYIFHILEVASTVVNLNCDLNTLLAAILHDVVEDSEVTTSQIEERFGTTTARIVEALTKMASIQSGGISSKRDTHYLRKNIVGAAGDLRVAYIKLADRLHNLTTLAPLRPDKGARSLQETRLYYAPLAGELGIHDLQRKLNKWCLKLEQPKLYRELEQIAESQQDEFQRTINRISYQIEAGLQRLGIMVLPPINRVLFELLIEQKGLNQGFRHYLLNEWLVRPYQIQLAFRSSRECYVALDLIHGYWPSILGQFVDSISKPLSNGYRAIHTMVQVENKKLLLFILTTREMYQDSEWGPLPRLVRAQNYEQSFMATSQAELLRQILLLDSNILETDSELFLEHLQRDILQPKVCLYVTEQGVVNIPKDSTIADLIFWIDQPQELVNRFFLVNDNVAGLEWKLRDGDVVTFKKDLEQPPNNPIPWELDVTHRTAKAHYALMKIGRWPTID